MKSRIVCFLYLIVCLYISSNRDQVGKFNNFHYDINGYYIYLPAVFIYNDLEQLNFQPNVSRGYGIGGGDFYSMHDVNGKRVNKYPVGVAISELPLFLIAHSYCKLSGKENALPDGYSDPYEYALVFSNILWSFLGLLVLRKFLLRLFTDNITTTVLICIGFGTNFYTYAVFTPGMSHNFSFFLFACILYFTYKWYRSFNLKHLCAIGFTLGFIVITRPVNLLSILIPLLWCIYNRETLRERVRMLGSRWRHLLLAIICFLLIAFVQMGYWKFITGHWIYFSYQGEEFKFAEPKIFEGLFSFRKGWFIYTPIAFVAIVGLFFTAKKYISSLIIFFALMIYIVFSWENWYYGGGFSARAMIETLPFLSIPLAFLTQKVWNKGKLPGRIIYMMVISFLVTLNIFQSYQYSKGIISYDRMSWDSYWYIFGKLERGPDYDKHLMPEQEYWDEIIEWQNN